MVLRFRLGSEHGFGNSYKVIYEKAVCSGKSVSEARRKGNASFIIHQPMIEKEDLPDRGKSERMKKVCNNNRWPVLFEKNEVSNECGQISIPFHV
jgi:hypothetical protein